VVKAIEYEKGLNRLRRVREKLNPVVRKNRHDDHIVDRICRLYSRFANVLRGDDRVALAHSEVAFLEQQKNNPGLNRKAGQVLGRLINEYPDREDVCIHAATWELEKHGNVDNARALLQRALRLQPAAQRLWKAYFMIEMTYLGQLLEKLREEQNNPDQQQQAAAEAELDEKLKVLLGGAIPRVVHEHAMKAVEGYYATPRVEGGTKRTAAACEEQKVALTVTFMRIASKFPFAAQIVRFLAEQLQRGGGGGAPSWPGFVHRTAPDFLVAHHKLQTASAYGGRALEEVPPAPETTDAPDARAAFAAFCDAIFAAVRAADAAPPIAGKQAAEVFLEFLTEAVKTEYGSAMADGTLLAAVKATPPARSDNALYKDVLKSLARSVADASITTHAPPAAAKAIASILAAADEPDAARKALDDCLRTHPSSADLHVALYALSPAPAVLSRALDAVGRQPEAWRLWEAAVLAAYDDLSLLKPTVAKALRTLSQSPVGPGRTEALERLGTVCMVADPAASLAALDVVHQLPESLAVQIAAAAISAASLMEEDEPAPKRRKPSAPVAVPAATARVRNAFDKLCRQVKNSPVLWAMRISWEQSHDAAKAVHLRTTVTRQPGGIAATDLDAALAKLEA
ncbi:U3 small nucleolar RNA-associated protein 6, partial [Diplonema papillatum]